MNLRTKLVVFDLDGTLLNTLNDLHASVNFALGTHHLPLRTLDEVREFVGNGIRRLIARAVPNDTPESMTESVFGTFREHYAQHSMDTTQPYAGVVELLSELKQQGIATAILSNKAHDAVQVLHDNFFPDTIDFAQGESVSCPRKPSPEGLLALMQRFACSPEQVLYVGDSDVDVVTAQHAGVRSVAVTWGFRSRELLEAHHPDYIIAHPSEMKAVLGWV